MRWFVLGVVWVGGLLGSVWGIGRSDTVPGEMGGTWGGLTSTPIVLFVADDSRSMQEAVVRWEDFRPPRPLRQARGVASGTGDRVPLLFSHAAGAALLPERERQALARRGRFRRVGPGNDSWTAARVQRTCTAAGQGLDGVPCAWHVVGLSGDDILRTAAATLRTIGVGGYAAYGIAVFVATPVGMRTVGHSLCGVRDDAVAPCNMAWGDPETVHRALSRYPAGVGRYTGLVAAFRWVRDHYILFQNRLPRMAAYGCRDVVLVVMSDFDLSDEAFVELQRVVDDIRRRVPTTRFVAVPLTEIDERRRDGLVQAFGPGTQFTTPRALVEDPVGVVVRTWQRQAVGCVARLWAITGAIPGVSPGPPLLARRSYMVGIWTTAAGVPVGRVGHRPWEEPERPEEPWISDEVVRWWNERKKPDQRRTYTTFPTGRRMETVRITRKTVQSVAQRLAPALGISWEMAQKLLLFHLGDPSVEVDRGGVFRNRCAPWIENCLGETELMGPILSPAQVMRIWRPTSWLSDFVSYLRPRDAYLHSWPIDATGAVTVLTSQGVTVFKVDIRGNAEEVWHWVPWGILQRLELSAWPTTVPIAGGRIQGYAIADRRYAAVMTPTEMTVIEVSGRGDRPVPHEPQLVFSTANPSGPAPVRAYRTRAVPLFVPKPRNGHLQLEAVFSIDPAPGRESATELCLVQTAVNTQPTAPPFASSWTKRCVDASPVLPSGWRGKLIAWVSGQRGYDMWFVFAPSELPQGVNPQVGSRVPSILVHYDAVGRRITGWWRVAIRMRWRDPTDGATQQTLAPILALRIILDEAGEVVTLVGGVGDRNVTPHGYFVSFWRRRLETRPSGSVFVVEDRNPQSYIAYARVERDGALRVYRSNRPWDRFCLRRGRLSMCTAWALVFEDVRTMGVADLQGPADFGLVPVMGHEWNCARRRPVIAWLAWPWLRSPTPVRMPQWTWQMRVSLFQGKPQEAFGQVVGDLGTIFRTAWQFRRPARVAVTVGHRVWFPNLWWPMLRFVPNRFAQWERR